MNRPVKTVAIIGAGTAGLCSAKHALASNMQVTIFETADQVGGTWVYTEDVGSDEHGLDVHTAMYKGLRTNLPIEIMGYPDFPIPSRENNSYVAASEIIQFLNLYAKTFNLLEHIKFKHYVVRIRPLVNVEQAVCWELIVRNLAEDRVDTYHFDAILVCNGHYHTPHWPQFPGRDLFQGQQIHSHKFRCSDPFKGELMSGWLLRTVFVKFTCWRVSQSLESNSGEGALLLIRKVMLFASRK